MKKYLTRTRINVSGSSNQSDQPTNADIPPQQENEEDRRDTSPCDHWIMLHIPSNQELPDCRPDPVTATQEVIATDYVEREQPNLENTILKKERSLSPEIPHQHGINSPMPPQSPLPDSLIMNPEPNGTSPKLCSEFIRGQCSNKEICPQTNEPFCRPPPQINQPFRTTPPQTNQPLRTPPSPTNQPFCRPPPQTNQPFRTPPPKINQPFSTAPPQTNQPFCRPPPQTNQPFCTPPPQTNQPFRTPPPQTNQPFSTPPPQTNQPFRTPPPKTNQPFCRPPPQTNQPFRTPPPKTNQSFCRPPPQTNQPFCRPPPQTKQPFHTTPPQTNQPFRTPPPKTNQPFCTPPPQTNQPFHTTPPQTNQPFLTPPPPTNQPFCTPPPQTNQPSCTPPPQTNQPFCTPPSQTNQPFCTLPPQTNQPFCTPPPQTNQPFHTTPPQTNQPFHTPPPQTNQLFCTPPPQTNQPFHTPPPQTNQPFCIPPPQTNQPFCSPPPQTNKRPSQDRFSIPPPQTRTSGPFHPEFRIHSPIQRDRFQFRLPDTYEPPSPLQPDSSLEIGHSHAPLSSPPTNNGYVIAKQIEELINQLEMEKPSKMEAEMEVKMEAPRPHHHVCRDFIRGRCDRYSCRYRHDRYVNKKIDRTQIITFCWDFQNYFCKLGSICKYVHATIFEEQDFYRTGKLPVHLILPRTPAPAFPRRTSASDDIKSIANNSRPTSASQGSFDEKPICKDESDPAVNPEDAVMDSAVASVIEKIQKEWERIKLHGHEEPDCSACCVNTGIFLLAFAVVVVIMTIVAGSFTFVVPWKFTLTAGTQLLQSGDDAQKHDGHHHQCQRERQQEQSCVHVVAQQSGLVLGTDKHLLEYAYIMEQWTIPLIK